MSGTAPASVPGTSAGKEEILSSEEKGRGFLGLFAGIAAGAGVLIGGIIVFFVNKRKRRDIKYSKKSAEKRNGNHES
jgi:hypothetical protein